MKLGKLATDLLLGLRLNLGGVHPLLLPKAFYHLFQSLHLDIPVGWCNHRWSGSRLIPLPSLVTSLFARSSSFTPSPSPTFLLLFDIGLPCFGSIRFLVLIDSLYDEGGSSWRCGGLLSMTPLVSCPWSPWLSKRMVNHSSRWSLRGRRVLPTSTPGVVASPCVFRSGNSLAILDRPFQFLVSFLSTEVKGGCTYTKGKLVSASYSATVLTSSILSICNHEKA